MLAGPTAVGKGTVSAYLREHNPQVWISVSMTTRDRGPGEVDGVHYRFVDDATFDATIDVRRLPRVGRRAQRGPLRHAGAAGAEALAAGRLALLEIDLQGARQVRRAIPDAVLVFLKPPSWDELVRRLVAPRLGKSAPSGNAGSTTAQVELAAEQEFDVTVVNDDVHRAAAELVTLMESTP